MSQDLIKSLLRSVGATIGGAVAAWFVSKGWLTASDATIVVGAITGVLLSAGALIWGMIAHREANLVATVAALPAVNKVETVGTEAGIALARAAATSIPGAPVTVAWGDGIPVPPLVTR